MLAAPEVIWSAVSDARLDDHIAASFRRTRLRCVQNPDLYDDDTADDDLARQACAGCPILLACREQALRQEKGAGASFGIRGGISAVGRLALIRLRPEVSGRVILEQTWTSKQCRDYLAGRGYRIARNTWSSKASRGVAPRPVATSDDGAHWDSREVIQWNAAREADHARRIRHAKTA